MKVFHLFVLVFIYSWYCVALPMDYLPNKDTALTRDELIKEYFYLGFQYVEILAFMQLYHNIKLSLRHLKRILHRNNMRRRCGKDDLNHVIQAIEYELNGTGRDLGYRAMHDRLRKIHKIVTDRETVRLILSHLDPEGVQLRSQRRLHRREYRVPGPNYLWHIDGYDKLKPYGLCIHGCIDGFSRRIMWLEVSSSNNNPYVICHYFVKCVKSLERLPNIIRADRGTENVNIETMQSFLRSAFDDRQSFLYGKSTANQRIEAWWSKFKQAGMNSWIEHFKDLESVGIIDTSIDMHKECIRFCYMNLLRTELNNTVKLWNTHYIRKSSNSEVSGKPDVIYHMPQIYGSQDYSKPFHNDELNTMSGVLSTEVPEVCHLHRELFEILMFEGRQRMPTNLREAADLLVYLLDSINA